METVLRRRNGNHCPSAMAHEVRPHGHQERRRNTTLRAWVATGEVQAKLPKLAIQSQEQLMREMHAMGRWKFWRLSAGDWMAARCRRVGTKHKDHFRRATAQLERDSVREGRVIWQCGPKFDYKTSRVREAHKPTDSMITELTKIAEELPFTTATCAQAIFNEYHRGYCRTQDGKD